MLLCQQLKLNDFRPVALTSLVMKTRASFFRRAINNLGSDLSLTSIAKIARCLQVFVLTRSFLSIRLIRK